MPSGFRPCPLRLVFNHLKLSVVCRAHDFPWSAGSRPGVPTFGLHGFDAIDLKRRLRSIPIPSPIGCCYPQSAKSDKRIVIIISIQNRFHYYDNSDNLRFIQKDAIRLVMQQV